MENNGNTQTSINERITEIAAKLFNRNISAMAREFDINQPALRDIASGKSANPRLDILQKLVDNSTFNINPYWLLTGKGNMVKTTAENDKNNIHLPNNDNCISSLQDFLTIQRGHIDIIKKGQEQIESLIQLTVLLTKCT